MTLRDRRVDVASLSITLMSRAWSGLKEMGVFGPSSSSGGLSAAGFFGFGFGIVASIVTRPLDTGNAPALLLYPMPLQKNT